MPKIPERDCCLIYAATPYVVCTVHPQSVSTEHCLDFRADPIKELQEQWSLEGYSFYDGRYDIANSKQCWSNEELSVAQRIAQEEKPNSNRLKL